MKRTLITGTGSYLPAHIVTNNDLAKKLDTSDDWIQQRTGIKSRHIAQDNELTSDMAIQASQKALEDAGLSAQDLDGIILATTTPDHTFPATAVKVQAALGMSHGFAFDIQAACSGFIYGMQVVDSFIQTGKAKNMLMIGAEKFSCLVDWEDRTTAVLFGDGAGAFVLQGKEIEQAKGRGILSTHIHSDGRDHDLLHTSGGPGLNKKSGVTKMEGKEVFKKAVTNLASVVEEALNHNHITSDQLDWLVPHQANQRIIESTAKKLNMPLEQVIMTVSQHGNTSAASIPLAFDVGRKDGRLKEGDLVLLEAMGAGFTWGAALVRL